MKERERGRQADLQKRIEGLQRELDVAQASQTQMASIRDSLTQEKELDLQAMRKELLLQKERQLQELRQDWMIQKEEIAQTYQKNLKLIQVELARDKVALQSEVESLHAENVELQKQLSDTTRKRRTKDFETQCTLVDIDGLYPRLLSLFGVESNNCPDVNSTENASDSVYTLCHDYVKHGHEERRDLWQELQKTQSSLSALQYSIEELERENSESNKAHQEELGLLKRVHASEVEALKSVYETSKKPSSSPSIHTKEDLERLNPGLLRELEQSWAAPLKKQIREEQTLTLQSLAAQYETKLKEFQDRFSKDRAELIQQHAEEMDSMSVRLKASCNAAFSQSVRQAKDQWHTEKTQWAARWRAKESEMTVSRCYCAYYSV
jgi:hypothetical protein